jgi:ESX secretion system ATPase EccB
MASRQEELDAYRFTVQRVVTALVRRESDAGQPALPRSAPPALAGLLVAVLALAAVAVPAVLGAAAVNWRNPSAIIIERESGARYVYRADALHPVLNYASALLLAGAGARVLIAPGSALRDAPRGAVLGIPGAPDSLPPRRRLLGAAWSLCSRPVAAPVPAGPGASSALLVGTPAPAGRLLGDDAVLVSTADGDVHLLWHGHRYRVPEPRVVLAALGWADKVPVPVALALVNAVPAGADLARIALPGRGSRVPRLPGARVGQVFRAETQGGARQYAVATPDGLASITQVQADLLLGDPDTVAAVGRHEATRVSPGELAAAAHAVSLAPAAGDAAPPASTPRLAGARGICAVVRGVEAGVEVRVDDAPASTGPPEGWAAGVATGGRSSGGHVLADTVVVPPGTGALVRAETAANGPGGTAYLVTDLGVRYPLAGPEVAAMLGYPGSGYSRLPAALVALLPTGPALDPAAAEQPVAP